jgi:hypothetical protein
MNCLACHYEEVEHNYELMKDYHLMAIEKEYSPSMFNLAKYYQYVEKKYELMKKYYLMAIEKEDSSAMNNLGHYYQTIEKNYELMIKYYLLAIQNNIKISMNNLKIYYDNNEFEFYFVLNGIENKNELIIEELNKLKQNVKIQHYNNKLSLAIKLNFTKECIICCNNDYQIIFNCGHHCCKNCFIKLGKCHICKTIF